MFVVLLEARVQVGPALPQLFGHLRDAKVRILILHLKPLLLGKQKVRTQRLLRCVGVLHWFLIDLGRHDAGGGGDAPDDLVLNELVVLAAADPHLLDLAHHLDRLTGRVCTIVDDLAVVVHDGVNHLALGRQAVITVTEIRRDIGKIYPPADVFIFSQLISNVAFLKKIVSQQLLVSTGRKRQLSGVPI